MNKFLKMSMLAVIAGFIFVGCTSATVYNVNKTELETKIPDETVYKAIKRAGFSKGWKVSKIKPGLAEATIFLRKHTAIVDIPYTSNSFSIVYKESTNLNFDSEKGTIHKNYNGWIQNLEKQINFEIASLDK